MTTFVKKLKTSLLSRSTQLIGVAGKIAGHELTQKVKSGLMQTIEERAPETIKTRIAQARILAENLSQLKGAAMKVGQLLSIDSSDILPPEATEILSQLQSFSEPVEFSQIEKVLCEDFQPDQLQLLNVDEKPYSSASIGQVHKGKLLSGESLAIKIQYPGVRESIGSDLALLKKIVGAFLTVSQKPVKLDELFVELRDILYQETDYLREMELLTAYSQKLKENNLTDSYIVPQVFPQFSTSRVLTMSFEEGVPLKDWINSNPSQEARNHMAKLVLDLYCREFFDWGLVQTDPNFGNFLVRGHQLVLLDFGATLTYDQTFIESYKNLLRSFSSFDDDQIIKASIDFKLLDPRESTETKQNYVRFMKNTLEPFLPHKQPFRFNDPDYTQRSVAAGRKFTTSLKYSPPPKHIIFLHRKLGGIFNLLRKMEVQMNLTPYWEKMVSSPLPELEP